MGYFKEHLNEARALLIVPSMIKAGFLIDGAAVLPEFLENGLGYLARNRVVCDALNEFAEFVKGIRVLRTR